MPVATVAEVDGTVVVVVAEVDVDGTVVVAVTEVLGVVTDVDVVAAALPDAW
jgi:hypothetical protein